MNSDQPTISMDHKCQSLHKKAWSTLEPHLWTPEEGFSGGMWNWPFEESCSLLRLIVQELWELGVVCHTRHENVPKGVLWWSQGTYAWASKSSPQSAMRVSTSAPVGDLDPYLWVYRLSKLKLRSMWVIRYRWLRSAGQVPVKIQVLVI